MKNSIPHHIPVIPALVKYVRLIAVLRNQPLNFSKIQDLRVFDLDTYHTLITRKSSRHTSRKSALPCNMGSNVKHDLACSGEVEIWWSEGGRSQRWQGNSYTDWFSPHPWPLLTLSERTHLGSAPPKSPAMALLKRLLQLSLAKDPRLCESDFEPPVRDKSRKACAPIKKLDLFQRRLAVGITTQGCLSMIVSMLSCRYSPIVFKILARLSPKN